ncbi:phosphoethanolamine transferase [Ideonella sp. DXS22W]|uniref:Phosphoethanolamine transferase n=1 Tax=Pseudaquabacterium inlustre TaxID=2984192 RepID=A0ABU9CKH0_9BURK
MPLAVALLFAPTLLPAIAWLVVRHPTDIVGLSPRVDDIGGPWFVLGLSVVWLVGPLALFGRSRLAVWALAPFALLAVPEAFYLLKFGQPSGPHVYGVLAETHADEVLAWLGPWWGWVLLTIMVSIAATVWACRQWWIADWHWQHRSRLWCIGGLAAMLLMVIALVLAEGQIADARDLEELPSDPLTEDREGLAARLEDSYPWGLPLRLARFGHHLRRVEARAQAVGRLDVGVRWISPAQQDTPAVHVLVIGETARPDRWGLFGGARDTTPRLIARSGIIAFSDAVSAAAATRESVPLLLTASEAYDAPSLMVAFRQAGFRTHWLSTQGAAGTHETPIAVLAHEADEHFYANPVDYKGRGALDGALLPRLKEILSRPEPRKLIVLHTLGSHLHYAHRYPPEFEHFVPALASSDRPDIWHDRHTPALINAYDNSVRYTDWFLDAVIAELQGTGLSATLMFVADHGEALFDGQCRRAGHGFAAEVNYRVPMFFWLSDAWQAANPQRTRALRANRDQPVSGRSAYATMTRQAGFNVTKPGAFPDLGSVPYTPPVRWTLHHGNFDRDLRGRSCSGPSPKLAQVGASAH